MPGSPGVGPPSGLPSPAKRCGWARLTCSLNLVAGPRRLAKQGFEARQISEIDQAATVQIHFRTTGPEISLERGEIGKVHHAVVVKICIAGVAKSVSICV